MMTPREVLSHVTAEPFRPFRVHMASGETYEVEHPEMVGVGKSTLTIFTPLDDDSRGDEMWYKLPLMLLEAIEPLETAHR